MKYRMLRKGEKVKKGDEYACALVWEKANLLDVKVGWDKRIEDKDSAFLYRRPIRAKGKK
jgi:hypothetical protein